MIKNVHVLKTEGVVLRHTDWGEADRILVLFTKEGGKQRAIAKGIRRLHSRKSGHLEPFTRVALILAKGRDLWIVTQAEALDLFSELGNDLIRTAHAAFVIELVDRFIPEDGENQVLYKLIVETLSRLEKEDILFHPLLYYEMRLLDLLGFRLQLFNCVNCQSEITAQDQFVSFLDGGILCPNCGHGRSTAVPISMQALKYLRHFQRSSYKDTVRASVAPPIQAEIEQHLEAYFTFLLERNLNSPSFLKEIRSFYKT